MLQNTNSRFQRFVGRGEGFEPCTPLSLDTRRHTTDKAKGRRLVRAVNLHRWNLTRMHHNTWNTRPQYTLTHLHLAVTFKPVATDRENEVGYKRAGVYAMEGGQLIK